MSLVARLAVLVSAPLLLSACGSGSGSVALELTDAPPDMASLAKIEVTLSSVLVHVARVEDKSAEEKDLSVKGKDDKLDIDKVGSVEHDELDGGWRTIVEHAGTFDLLSLQNDVTAPLGEIDLPDGKITQIRLHIDEAGRNVAVLKDGRECPLDLKEVDKKGIKINHPFKALEASRDGKLRVVVDFDVKESLDQGAEVCSLKLKPVIKIKKAERYDGASKIDLPLR